MNAEERLEEKSNILVIKTTKVYESILKAWNDGKRGIFLEGGTYSSKTYSALQALIAIASDTKMPQTLDIDVVSESIPHLKGGCIKDFFNILGETTAGNSSTCSKGGKTKPSILPNKPSS